MRPTDDQILALLDSLAAGDHLAQSWDSPAQVARANRCVVYLRVSSKQQLDGEGLADQWRACAQFAARQGWAIVGLYVDPAISGRKESRPAIDRLKRDAAGKRFSSVLFFKVNRVGRNARASYETAEEIERHGLAVVSATEPFVRGTAAGNLTFGMLVTFAQFGSDQLGEVMRTRLGHKAQVGHWVGPVPFGCRVVDGVLTATTHIALVERIWRMYNTAIESYTSIADALNADGHCTQSGALFSRESIRVILKQRAYLGFVSSKQEYRGAHAPMFPDAERLYMQNMDIMARRTRQTTTRRAVGEESWAHGLCYCEVCYQQGRPAAKLWHHSSGSGAGKMNRYFRCSGHSKRTHSGAKLISALVVEDQVRELLGELVMPAEQMHTIVQQARVLATTPATSTRTTALTADQITQQIERLGEAYADGAVSRERYQRRLHDLRTMLDEARHTTPPMPTFHEAHAMELLQELPVLLAHASSAHLRSIAAAVIECLWADTDGIHAIAPRADFYPFLAARSDYLDLSV
jgi:DNA invertase Pin-like site-specific DNA recombinase